MVSNLALNCKATDKTEITASSERKKKKVMDVNSLFCLCSKMIISDDEKWNNFDLVFKSLEILLLLFVLRSF